MLVSVFVIISEGLDISVVVFVGAGSTVIEAGLKFLKNLLFRLVNLPDPSTFMMYWSWPATSTTVPVRCHLFGLFPVWF